MNQQEYFDRFCQITEQMNQLTKVKNTDYAEANDAFANFKVVELLTDGRISAEAGIFTRITDKLKRIASLISREAMVKDETLEDTLMDLAVYSVIMRIWLEEKRKQLVFKKGDSIKLEIKNVADKTDAYGPVGMGLRCKMCGVCGALGNPLPNLISPTGHLYYCSKFPIEHGTWIVPIPPAIPSEKDIKLGEEDLATDSNYHSREDLF